MHSDPLLRRCTRRSAILLRTESAKSFKATGCHSNRPDRQLARRREAEGSDRNSIAVMTTALVQSLRQARTSGSRIRHRARRDPGRPEAGTLDLVRVPTARRARHIRDVTDVRHPRTHGRARGPARSGARRPLFAITEAVATHTRRGVSLRTLMGSGVDVVKLGVVAHAVGRVARQLHAVGNMRRPDSWQISRTNCWP